MEALKIMALFLLAGAMVLFTTVAWIVWQSGVSARTLWRWICGTHGDDSGSHAL